MSDHGITKENLLAAFPVSLRESGTMSALAEITAEILEERLEEIKRLSIYPRIHELPEDLLDILAYDFKVDWWDPNYTLEEKRRTLADSWRVHKTLGTKGAVETAIRAIYPKSEVKEWFEYGGKPYYFKLLIDMTGEDPDPARRDRVLERVNFYKNLRSHVDAIEYTLNAEPVTYHFGGLAAMVVRLPVPEQPDELNFQDEIHAGGHLASVVTLPIPEAPDSFDFRDGFSLGGMAASTVKLPIPEQQDRLTFQGEMRLGGQPGGPLAHLPVAECPDELHAETTVRSGGKMAFRARLPTVQYYAAQPPEGG